MKAMVGWRFDEPMEHLADPPPRRADVLAAPPGYAGGPPLPQTALPAQERAGDWTLHTSC